MTAFRVTDEEKISVIGPELLHDPTVPPTSPSGASGLFSTAADYFNFTQMLLNGGVFKGKRILRRETVEYMTQNHLPDNVSLPSVWGQNYGLDGYGFGLGFRVRLNVEKSQLLGNKGEYGWAGAYETYFLIDPNVELIAIFMTQLSPSSYYPIRRQFTDLVYRTIVSD